eukprot:12396313-Karenia_brevis.AAC.1
MASQRRLSVSGRSSSTAAAADVNNNDDPDDVDRDIALRAGQTRVESIETRLGQLEARVTKNEGTCNAMGGHNDVGRFGRNFIT